MSEPIESAEAFAERTAWDLVISGTTDNPAFIGAVRDRDAAMKLAGKRELLDEISEDTNRRYATRNSNYGDMLEDAFDAASDKYATPAKGGE